MSKQPTTVEYTDFNATDLEFTNPKKIKGAVVNISDMFVIIADNFY